MPGPHSQSQESWVTLLNPEDPGWPEEIARIRGEWPQFSAKHEQRLVGIFVSAAPAAPRRFAVLQPMSAPGGNVQKVEGMAALRAALTRNAHGPLPPWPLEQSQPAKLQSTTPLDMQPSKKPAPALASLAQPKSQSLQQVPKQQEEIIKPGDEGWQDELDAIKRKWSAFDDKHIARLECVVKQYRISGVGAGTPYCTYTADGQQFRSLSKLKTHLMAPAASPGPVSVAKPAGVLKLSNNTNRGQQQSPVKRPADDTPAGTGQPKKAKQQRAAFVPRAAQLPVRQPRYLKRALAGASSGSTREATPNDTTSNLQLVPFADDDAGDGRLDAAEAAYVNSAGAYPFSNLARCSMASADAEPAAAPARINTPGIVGVADACNNRLDDATTIVTDADAATYEVQEPADNDGAASYEVALMQTQALEAAAARMQEPLNAAQHERDAAVLLAANLCGTSSTSAAIGIGANATMGEAQERASTDGEAMPYEAVMQAQRALESRIACMEEELDALLRERDAAVRQVAVHITVSLQVQPT